MMIGALHPSVKFIQKRPAAQTRRVFFGHMLCQLRLGIFMQIPFAMRTLFLKTFFFCSSRRSSPNNPRHQTTSLQTGGQNESGRRGLATLRNTSNFPQLEVDAVQNSQFSQKISKEGHNSKSCINYKIKTARSNASK
jgi:hypothetical protein